MLRILSTALLMAAMLPTIAYASDMPEQARPVRHHHATAMHGGAENASPWSWRMRKIRRATRCWRSCEAETARAFQACLRIGNLNGCVQRTETADRDCQRTCRIYGGPLITVE
jgi:hypothetical protein